MLAVKIGPMWSKVFKLGQFHMGEIQCIFQTFTYVTFNALPMRYLSSNNPVRQDNIATVSILCYYHSHPANRRLGLDDNSLQNTT